MHSLLLGETPAMRVDVMVSRNTQTLDGVTLQVQQNIVSTFDLVLSGLDCLSSLSSVSLTETTKKFKTTLLALSLSSPNWPYLSSCFSPLAAQRFTNTLQTCKYSVLQLPQLDHSWLLDWTPYKFKFTHQPATYTLLLTLPFFVFPLLMLHHLSGTVSLAKSGHQTHSHLLNHL